MWVIALEALVALSLLLLIVWLTMGSAPHRDRPNETPAERNSDSGRE